MDENDEETKPERIMFGKDMDADGIAEAIVKWINDERARRGLPPMKNSDRR